MDCTSVITGIVVPLCSVLLGGGLTLLGVWLTIKDQRKKEEAARKASARPWIFSCENEILPPEHMDCIMVPDYCEANTRIGGNIKNTDNGILILDHVKSQKTIYRPNNGDIVVEKNATAELLIFFNDSVESLQELFLIIRDVYGNCYQYELVINGVRFTLGKCEEVGKCPTLM